MSPQRARKAPIMSNAVIVMLMLSASPASAEQSMPTPRPNARFGALRPSASDPYQKLFEPHKGIQRSIDAPVSKPKVVCGMTIIPADPTIDPQMEVSPKQDRNLKYTIRSIDPPICNPSR